MALGELLAVWTADHGDVGEDRRGVAQGLVHQDLARGVGEVVVAADDVGHLHVDVVADHGEVVGGAAVAAHDDHVVLQGRVEVDVAVDGVVHGDHAAVLGHLEAPDIGLASRHALLALLATHAAAGVGVGGQAVVLDGLAAHLVLLGRAKAGVGAAVGVELGQCLAVGVEALGLQVGAVRAAHLGALVPVKAQPAHGADDEVDVFLGGALGVGVLDAQDELAAGGAGIGPVVDGSAGAADVELARGAGGKADANFSHGDTPRCLFTDARDCTAQAVGSARCGAALPHAKREPAAWAGSPGAQEQGSG